ncbi:MAG: hypothetical protein GEU73_02020 [Chloroflexi bacterium]|nr:hypothetical protein [Chloroflexota bacterium]
MDNPRPEGAPALPESILRRLRAAGVRMTAQRRAVIDAALQRPTDEVGAVLDRVRETCPNVQRRTVQRTLNVLRQAGLSDALDEHPLSIKGSGPAPWRPAEVQCERCGQMLELELEALAFERADIGETRGYVVTGRRLDFIGICPNCARSLDFPDGAQSAREFRSPAPHDGVGLGQSAAVLHH